MKIKILYTFFPIFLFLVLVCSINTHFAAPIAEIDEYITDLGFVSTGSIHNRFITVRNMGESDLILRVTDHSEEIILDQQEILVQPSEEKMLLLSLTPVTSDTLFIRIDTNDPQKSHLMLFFRMETRDYVFVHPAETLNITRYPGDTNIEKITVLCLDDNLEIKGIENNNELLHYKVVEPYSIPYSNYGVRSAKEIWFTYSDKIQPGQYSDLIRIITNYKTLLFTLNAFIKPCINVLPLSVYFNINRLRQEPFYIHLIHTEQSVFTILDASFDADLFNIEINSGADPFVKIIAIELISKNMNPGIYNIQLKVDEKKHEYINIPVYMEY